MESEAYLGYVGKNEEDVDTLTSSGGDANCTPVADYVHLNKYADYCDTIQDIINTEHQENAFFVCDVNVIIDRYRLWKSAMPRVIPFYAVKCNDYSMVLKVLAAMGIGFDCASLSEIQKVLSIGVEPSRIIFANTVKPFSHIRYASHVNVDLITFDNETELYKLKKMFPRVRAVIRIRYDAKALICLGSKFGCNPDTEAPKLLQKARSLGINVVGVSFHIGSGCYQPSAFYNAIKASKRVFDFASTIGYTFTLLDIGGGFTTRHHIPILEFAKYINDAIEEFFPEETVTIISEPGTYFVETSFTLACNIHSKKYIQDENCKNDEIMYYINDGVFGSFLIRQIDQDIKIPQPLKKYPRSNIYPSTVWGPTMDSTDLIVRGILLPEMDIDDWIVFSNMGDYTLSSSTSFNSFELPDIYNIINHSNWSILSTTKFFKSSDFTRKGNNKKKLLMSKKERYRDNLANRG